MILNSFSLIRRHSEMANESKSHLTRCCGPGSVKCQEFVDTICTRLASLIELGFVRSVSFYNRIPLQRVGDTEVILIRGLSDIHTDSDARNSAVAPQRKNNVLVRLANTLSFILYVLMKKGKKSLEIFLFIQITQTFTRYKNY